MGWVVYDDSTVEDYVRELGELGASDQDVAAKLADLPERLR